MKYYYLVVACINIAITFSYFLEGRVNWGVLNAVFSGFIIWLTVWHWRRSPSVVEPWHTDEVNATRAAELRVGQHDDTVDLTKRSGRLLTPEEAEASDISTEGDYRDISKHIANCDTCKKLGIKP